MNPQMGIDQRKKIKYPQIKHKTAAKLGQNDLGEWV
jgi:hypothetical protein